MNGKVKDVTESDTRYIKGSQTKTPSKSKHKHEYIRVVCWAYIRRMDGSVSDRKHKISKRARCIHCDHVNRKAYISALEVEVRLEEYQLQS